MLDIHVIETMEANTTLATAGDEDYEPDMEALMELHREQDAFDRSERFGEDIGNLSIRLNISKFDFTAQDRSRTKW